MNRLAQETSPYLLQHAHNPVDWYPWSAEALKLAKRLDRPILLSIGYSACHWCHVMERECFENPEIARQMNEFFVCIKVDREERPDLDQLYQAVPQLYGRGGGWPLTVFLTPSLVPFFGGTYFPPKNRSGMPGLPKVMAELSRAWKEERDQVDAQAASLLEGLRQLTSYGLDAPPGEWAPEDPVQAARALEKEIDAIQGGFGLAPKFPMASSLSLLFRGWRRSGDAALSRAALVTLEKMAEGGIYDQLGGGFHRYSVDPQWSVPHFEKMLYDNAQLLFLYSEAQQIEPRPLWRKVVEETAEYVRRELTSPQGGFYSTQDADSEGVEGKFFVWTPAQVEEALPKELVPLALRHFGVTQEGNFEHGATVLHVAQSAEELARELQRPLAQVNSELARARSLLFEAREPRIKPGRDEKILTGWNGLMIRGLAQAARVFQRPEWATLAKGAADDLLAHRLHDGRLSRLPGSGPAFLEDYGHLAAGLCALYQATFEEKYLQAAKALVDQAGELFWDEAQTAYLTAPRGQADLLVPTFSLFDEAVPSGASMLTEAQLVLAALRDEPAALERPTRYLARMREQAMKSPLGFSHLLLAADTALDGAAEVTLVGQLEELAGFLAAVNGTYAPTLAVRAGEVAHKARPPRERLDGKPAAYLCRRFSCEPPLSEPGTLVERLSPAAARA